MKLFRAGSLIWVNGISTAILTTAPNTCPWKNSNQQKFLADLVLPWMGKQNVFVLSTTHSSSSDRLLTACNHLTLLLAPSQGSLVLFIYLFILWRVEKGKNCSSLGPQCSKTRDQYPLLMKLGGILPKDMTWEMSKQPFCSQKLKGSRVTLKTQKPRYTLFM